METYGVVVSIQKYGLLVSFLNDIKGLLPRQEISTLYKKDEDLKDLYYLGQLIKCKVLDFNKQKQLVKVSLIMDETKKVNKKLEAKKKDEIQSDQSEPEFEIGDLIEAGSVLQVGKDNNYFRVKLPSGKKMESFIKTICLIWTL